MASHRHRDAFLQEEYHAPHGKTGSCFSRAEHMFKRSSGMHIGSIFPISSLLIRIALIPIVPEKMRRRKSFGHLSRPSRKTRLGSFHSEKMEF